MWRTNRLVLFALCLAVAVHASALTAAQSVSLPCGLTVGSHVYDFSALTRTEYFYTFADASYFYVFNICGNVTNFRAPCAGSICQYTSNGNFIANVAAWSAADGGPTWTVQNGSPSMQTANGDACWPTSQPRQASFNFICVEDVEVGNWNVSESACGVSITVPTKFACTSAPLPCSAPFQGHNYSFSPLTLTSEYYVVNSTTSQSMYKFNVCGDVLNDITCLGAAMCQYNFGGRQWQHFISYWTHSNGGPTWTAGNNTFAVQTMNGDVCTASAKPRTATIDFTCDTVHLVGALSINDESACDYVITFPTKLACST